MHVKLTNGQPDKFPYSVAQLRRDTPLTGFPKATPADLLAQYDVFPVTVAAQPEYDPQTQQAEPDAMPSLVDGQWVVGWTVRDLTREERLERQPYRTAEEARKEMVRWIDGLSAQILDLYPRAVQARWTIEEAAARAVLNDTDTDAQLELITREGAAKGRTPGEHAQAIIANANKFRAITDEINTLFLATDTAILQANDPLEYPAILARAKEQAAPLAEAYGLK